MIPGITELNFPSYATLSEATASLSDMGDMVISAQVKIDGDVTPSFIGTDGKDWAVMFNGHKYIQPIHKPQARKDNSSLSSQIDLVFKHYAIYEMQRYYVVELASTASGTAIADKYQASVSLYNVNDFAKLIHDMLAFYFPNGEIYVPMDQGKYVYHGLEYTDEQVYVDINYSYIWDVLLKCYELFNVRWTIEVDQSGNYAVKFGYPATDLTHEFSYGYEGGLLSIERQVQDDNIRNQLLGRGGEKNLPYLYFKNYELFHPNSSNVSYSNHGCTPDPDAIPELENIYFDRLRDSNFRSYVQGWKTNPNRILDYGDWHEDEPEVYDAQRGAVDWAYEKGHNDTRFDPVEYVKDDESIEEYGLLQGGLEDNDDIFPTLQGMEIELPCTVHQTEEETPADEVVDVEEVTTDEINVSEGGSSSILVAVEAATHPIAGLQVYEQESGVVTRRIYITNFYQLTETLQIASKPFEVADNERAVINTDIEVKVLLKGVRDYYLADPRAPRFEEEFEMEVSGCSFSSVFFKKYLTGEVVDSQIIEEEGRYNIQADEFNGPETIDLPLSEYITTYNGVELDHELVKYYESYRKVVAYITFTTNVGRSHFVGQILPNRAENTSFYASPLTSVGAGQTVDVTVYGDTFTVPEGGAMFVDCPIAIRPPGSAAVLEYTKTVEFVNTSSGETTSGVNIPMGTYRLKVTAAIKNNAQSSVSLVMYLQPAKVYYNVSTNEWKPTFDIWIKNVFKSSRLSGETDENYVTRIWHPLKTDEEMKVTFSSGMLSGHSDWEFPIYEVHFDDSKTITDANGHTFKSEWRLTLVKTDAEAQAIGKYIPYSGLNAAQGDRFFFTGIYMPYIYVTEAERRLNGYKEDNLGRVSDVQPTWVVKLDKVRMNQADDIASHLKAGAVVHISDSRFLPTGMDNYLQSITYTWRPDYIVPEIDIVLTNEYATTASPVQQIQGQVEELTKRVGTLSDIESRVRSVGNTTWLRKDGGADTSFTETTFASRIKSTGFREGVIGGAGWGMYVNGNNEAVIEADRILVRHDLEVNNLVANQITAMGGKEIMSAAHIHVSRIEAYISEETILSGSTLETEQIMFYRCYFDQHDGTVGNLFVVGDIAMGQTFDPQNNETTKYYRRVVKAVGNGYIDLSNDPSEIDGSGAPSDGDEIVQYGHTSNKARQYVIIRDVIEGARTQYLSNLDSVSAVGTEYAYTGMATVGGTPTPRFFIGRDQQYIEYKNGNLKIKADVTFVGSSAADYNAVSDAAFGAAQNYDDMLNDGIIDEYTRKTMRQQWVEINGADNTTQTTANGSYPITIAAFESQLRQTDGTYMYMGTVYTRDDIVYLYNDTGRTDLDSSYNALKAYINDIGLYTEGTGYSSAEYNQKRIAYLAAEQRVKDNLENNLRYNNDDFKKLTAWINETDSSVTRIDGGVVLSTLLGVAENNATKLVAGINASGGGPVGNEWVDPTHGKIMIFAGADGADDVPNSPFRVYPDGHVVANDLVANGAVISGSITASSGSIGDFVLSSGAMVAVDTESNTRMSLSKDLVHFTGTNQGVNLRMGSNVLPASLGSHIAAIKIDIDDTDQYHLIGDNVGLMVDVKSVSNNVSNFAVYATSGMYAGFRPYFKAVGATEQLSNIETAVMPVENSTVTLPENPQNGQFHMIFNQNNNVTVRTTDGITMSIYSKGNIQTNLTIYTFSSNFVGIVFSVYNKTNNRWYLFPVSETY